jgi:alkyl hydroperoxide reductase subunit AhpC
VEVMSVSVDSVHSHKVWNETELSNMVEGGVAFPMLSDQTGAIGRMYGVYDEDAGVNIRGRFLIDPDGVVQAAEVLSPPVGRNPEELIRQIKASTTDNGLVLNRNKIGARGFFKHFKIDQKGKYNVVYNEKEKALYIQI